MDEQEHDPDEQAFVRGLLEEAGREPDPLPDEVRDRLDDVLAGLVAERAQAAPGSPAVVPLDRARTRRRRRVQVLAAAAAVLVGGYAVTTSGLLGGVGEGEADSATAGDAASGASDAAPEAGGAGSGAGSFPLSSGSLREDARLLVGSDQRAYLARQEAAAPTVPEPSAPGGPVDDGSEAAPQPATGATAGKDLAPPGAGSRTSGRVSGCADPLVPARLTRLSVTYDGVAATAVLRPLPAAGGGTPRVRVEVWDCGAPIRLAAVVVRR